MDEGVLLSEFGIPRRVEIAVGLYKGTPIVVFEHQIGPSPVEIYCRELLSDQLMTNCFAVNNRFFESDAKYIVRLGTSLGINHKKKNENAVHLNIGDINVCNKQIGISSVDFQAITSNLNPLSYHTLDVNKTIAVLNKYGYETQIDQNNEIWPVIEFDADLRAQLIECTQSNLKKMKNANANKVVSLNNVSKDSLYAEDGEDAFYELRRVHNVGTSEMESGTILRVSKLMEQKYKNRIKVGATYLCVGVIPGASFASIQNKKDLDDIHWISTLDALHQISQKHIVKRSKLSKL